MPRLRCQLQAYSGCYGSAEELVDLHGPALKLTYDWLWKLADARGVLERVETAPTRRIGRGRKSSLEGPGHVCAGEMVVGS